MAAPRAERSDGLMAVGEVDGERMVVVGGKREVRRLEMRGVWDVPPERMTFEIVSIHWWDINMLGA